MKNKILVSLVFILTILVIVSYIGCSPKVVSNNPNPDTTGAGPGTGSNGAGTAMYAYSSYARNAALNINSQAKLVWIYGTYLDENGKTITGSPTSFWYCYFYESPDFIEIRVNSSGEVTSRVTQTVTYSFTTPMTQWLKDSDVMFSAVKTSTHGALLTNSNYRYMFIFPGGTQYPTVANPVGDINSTSNAWLVDASTGSLLGFSGPTSTGEIITPKSDIIGPKLKPLKY